MQNQSQKLKFIKFFIRFANRHVTIVKFVISGGAAAATNLGLLYVFTDIFGVYYLVSACLSFLIAFFVSFFLQKYWTFRDKSRDRLYSQMAVYFITVFGGMLANAGLMYLSVEWLGIWYMLAQVIVGAVLAVANFLVYRFVVFKKSGDSGSADREQPAGKNRILIATPIFPPTIGGPATYSKILCEELPERGFEVKVVTYGERHAARSTQRTTHNTQHATHNTKQVDKDTRYKIQDTNNREYPSSGNGGAKVVEIFNSGNKLVKYWRFFLAVWREIPKADIVYIQDTVNAGLPARLACLLRDKPYILKVTGDYAWEHAQECHGVADSLDEFQNKHYNRRIEMVRKTGQATARLAERVITPSEYLKKIVSGWGVEKNKINVVYNSVKPAKTEENEEKLRHRLSLAGMVIISVGRLVPWKGFGTLIDMMPDLRRKIPDISLILIGEGPEQASIEAKIGQSGEKGRIRFIPGLPQDEMWQYLKASDLLVLNTGYEGLPHVVIEAMMLGTPVVTTRVGGNIEVIENDKNGILVEYDNREQLKSAIIGIFNNQERRMKMVNQAQADTGKFSREKMIRETVDIFERKEASNF